MGSLSIIRVGTFSAEQYIPVVINIADGYFSGNSIYLVTDCGYEHAMGLYNLCIEFDLQKFTFILINATSGNFAYFYIPSNWFAKRQGYQKPGVIGVGN